MSPGWHLVLHCSQKLSDSQQLKVGAQSMGHEEMLTIIQKHYQPVTVSLLYDHTQLLSEDTNNSNPPPILSRENRIYTSSVLTFKT